MKNQQPTATDIFNSCIQIDRVRISRKLAIPRQIVFRFEPKILSQIEQAKENNHQFILSPGNLADLRYYALLNYFSAEQLDFCQGHLAKLISLEQLRDRVAFESPLIFTSNYLFSHSQSKKVVRSIINSEGQISQQVQQDLWQNPQLLAKVTKAHYWLILQILAQLPLKVNNSLTRLFKTLWLATLIVFSICLWIYLPLDILLKILIISFSIYLFTNCLKQTIKNKFKIWILYSLINGFWSNSTKKHQIAWNAISVLS